MPRVSDDVALARRLPRWAAMLVARLTQDQPEVVTRLDLSGYLDEIGLDRDVDGVIRELVKLKWLRASRRKGVWLFLPPGETSIGDPYRELRAWAAHDDQAAFALAGEAAAWHLGYLDRRHEGPIPIWVPEGVAPPFGLRPVVSVVRLGWNATMSKTVHPSREMLRRRRLDLTEWASRLPAFGPEALLIQLAVRPSSFWPWMDFVAHLGVFASDCDANRVTSLLIGKSSSAWQRGAYLLSVGGNHEAASAVLAARPHGRLSHVTLGGLPGGVHVGEFGVTDRLVVPLMEQVGKA